MATKKIRNRPGSCTEKLATETAAGGGHLGLREEVWRLLSPHAEAIGQELGCSADEVRRLIRNIPRSVDPMELLLPHAKIIGAALGVSASEAKRWIRDLTKDFPAA